MHLYPKYRPGMSEVVESLKEMDHSEFNVKPVKPRKPSVRAPVSNEGVAAPVSSGPAKSPYAFSYDKEKGPYAFSYEKRPNEKDSRNKATIQSFTPKKRGARGPETKERIFWC